MYFKKKINKNSGFSLIELMVVMGIMAVISGISIFNYGKFSSSLVVTNLAYQAALAVRQAQVYGISVKQTGTGTSANFNSPYGVWFSTDDLNFHLFSDRGAPLNQYSIDENEETYKLGGGNKILYFCVTYSSGKYCSNGPSGLSALSIIFKRPEPNALIYGFTGNSSSGYISVGASNQTFSDAQVMFTSAKGDKISRIKVTNTGQISVNSCNDGVNSCPTE